MIYFHTRKGVPTAYSLICEVSARQGRPTISSNNDIQMRYPNTTVAVAFTNFFMFFRHFATEPEKGENTTSLKIYT